MNEQMVFLSSIRNKFTAFWGKAEGSYWHNRIVAELLFALKMTEMDDLRPHMNSVLNAVDRLKEYCAENNAIITKAIVLELESSLSDLSPLLKDYRIICAAHAHIDMNWMWGEAETVAVTLETFRTMLNLLEEYDEFVFSQSQASVYEIAEKYDPAMLAEIKRRVEEKRWQVIASTWVETDKNMPNGESLSRHILYTKKYIQQLFGISPDDLVLDFEPDTFGHNLNVPEILNRGGVKYYYHCRGQHEHQLYRYASPSGSETLVYCDPQWYLGIVTTDFMPSKADFFKESGVKTGLKVYGVGDHGGGPSRRDIETFIDMQKWPLFPVLEFGTYNDFFKAVEPFRANFPVVNKELNFIFDGCYTSQSRIKASNRIGENRLYQAETLSAFSAAFQRGWYDPAYFADAWKKILYNQFHDILPGSGMIDTREAALGSFQESLARANTAVTNSMRCLASSIDTAGMIPEEDTRMTISEGAGVGYRTTADFSVPSAERGSGKGRIYHVFNPTAFAKDELIKFQVWDWPGQINLLHAEGPNGEALPSQIIGRGTYDAENPFWGHEYMTLAVKAPVPPFGYTTITIRENADLFADTSHEQNDSRVLTPFAYALENELISVAFDPMSMEIRAITDNETGKRVAGKGALRLVHEDPSLGMTSWILGKYNGETPFTDVKITDSHINRGALHQWITYTTKMGNSSITVTVSLNAGRPFVEYLLAVNWFEKGTKETYIPQLQYYIDADYHAERYVYDIPFGLIERAGINHDVPGLSFICLKNVGGKSLSIITKTKYGYRGGDNRLAVSLLRSSFNPDPYPEICLHKIEFSVGLTNAESGHALLKQSTAYNYPAQVISGGRHQGSRERYGSFMTCTEDIIVSAIKMAEDNSGDLIIRLFEANGAAARPTIKFSKPVRSALFTDINETPAEGIVAVDEDAVSFDVPAHTLVTLRIGL